MKREEEDFNTFYCMFKKQRYRLWQWWRQWQYVRQHRQIDFNRNLFESAWVKREHVPYQLDWGKLGFEKNILDFGSGNGDFSLAMAEAYPKDMVVGVELHRAFLRKGARKAEQRDLNNVKFVHDNGVDFLKFLVAPQSLDLMCINFPDPWHKKRHHKRRLFTTMFFQLVLSRLKEGGELYFVSDNEEIFQYAREHAELVFAVEITDVPKWYPQSKYHRKWLREGREILCFRKSHVSNGE